MKKITILLPEKYSVREGRIVTDVSVWEGHSFEVEQRASEDLLLVIERDSGNYYTIRPTGFHALKEENHYVIYYLEKNITCKEVLDFDNADYYAISEKSLSLQELESVVELFNSLDENFIIN